MTEIFSKKDKLAAKKTLKTQIFIGVGLIVCYICFVVFVMIVQTREAEWLYIALLTLVTVLVCYFLLFMFSIKFRLTRDYVRMLKNIDTGEETTEIGTFIGVDDATETKDGVEFRGLLFDVKPIRRDDITLRKLLHINAAPMLEFESGDKIEFTTHGNILVRYEIIKKSENKDFDK